MHPLIRRIHIPFAVCCVGLFLWALSVSLGWLPYDGDIRRSNVIFSGALATQSLSFVAHRRSEDLSGALILVALVLLGWATVDLSQGR